MPQMLICQLFNKTQKQMPVTLQRVNQEINNLVSLNPDDDDDNRWIGDIDLNPSSYKKFVIPIKGPNDSPYQNKWLKISVDLPDEYPLKAPLVKFQIPIYHCNVDKGGKMCLNLLSQDWQPNNTLADVVKQIYSRLVEADPDHPSDAPDRCTLYKTDKAKYNKLAADSVKNYDDA